MKRKTRKPGEKLQLAKETIRLLLSEDLQRAGGGGTCPSRTGCSTATSASLNECETLYCSMIQY